MSTEDLTKRIVFHHELEIMEVDFSDYIFDNSKTVNVFYDLIERAIKQTGRNWYFMVNYKNTKIFPDAWFRFALRGKEVNIAHSMGSVRYDPQEPTRDEILARAKREDFNPNIVATRDEALERIEELKRAAKDA